MSFKDQLKTDALVVFLNENEFAEEISYTPKGGAAKTIKAIVDRERPLPLGEEGGRSLVDRAEIHIANDATYGVAVVNKRGDDVSIPREVGGASVSMKVVDILGCDNGVWHLLCQA